MTKLSRQKIVLTPFDNALAGKINGDAEHVHVLLDSTLAPFTVVLPDATATMQREIICKNIGTNDVTIIPIDGQFLDTSTSHVISPLDLVSFWPDLVKTWWMLDNNSQAAGTQLTENWKCSEDSVTHDLVYYRKIAGVWTEYDRMVYAGTTLKIR
jgi:hypothetical protein